MGAFDAIKKAEEFGKTYAQKRDILATSHMEGGYDDEPSMKGGRYDETGRRRDGRKRIQGYTAAQRYTGMANREEGIQRDMDDLKKKKRMTDAPRQPTVKRDASGFPTSAY